MERTMSNQTKHPETLVLHAGWRSDPATNAVAVPIYQTTSYQFDSAEHAANLFGLKELGNIYTRIMNPTQDAFEKRVAAVEGGVAALGLASGQAASAFSVQNLARAGDNIVSSTDLYGGTWNLFANTLKDQGIEARFVDPTDPEAFARATDNRTRAYYAETLPNPKLIAFPIAEVAAIGRKFGIPLIMDNTAAPVLVRPFDHGAAVVMYSTTKYIGGHGTSIGGVVIDGGNFPWDQHKERQPLLNTPDPSYHGAVWAEAAKPLGPIAYILRMRVVLLRDLGAAMSPFNAFLFLQGLESMPLRMREHCKNTLAVAKYLSGRKEVTRVIHPAFHTGVGAERTAKYLQHGHGGLMGFELAGGVEAGRAFINALQMFYHVANIGDSRSLAIHPASTTHSQLTEAEQLATGVTPGYIRLSIGIEHIDDIIGDLSQALDAAGGGLKAAAE
jgi:O-acetylhomoserine (thiol)-lyase